MRSYPLNSPQAAARIVALALISDGHVDKRELNALDRIAAHEQLGMARDEMHAVVQTLCEDLMLAAQLCWDSAWRLDAAAMAELMAEVDDPVLWRKLMQVCESVIDADGHVSDGELTVIRAAAEHATRQSLQRGPREPLPEPLPS
jgi:uncharacterized tellurite resistance protein B-like protein